MANGTATYSITNMRVVPTTGKVLEKNPDRLLTIYGEFHAVDANGKVAKEPLSITQKVIDRETALNPLTVVDRENGMLTLPSGERGRKASEGVAQDDIDALLASVRETASEATASAE